MDDTTTLKRIGYLCGGLFVTCIILIIFANTYF